MCAIPTHLLLSSDSQSAAVCHPLAVERAQAAFCGMKSHNIVIGCFNLTRIDLGQKRAHGRRSCKFELFSVACCCLLPWSQTPLDFVLHGELRDNDSDGQGDVEPVGLALIPGYGIRVLRAKSPF